NGELSVSKVERGHHFAFDVKPPLGELHPRLHQRRIEDLMGFVRGDAWGQSRKRVDGRIRRWYLRTRLQPARRCRRVAEGARTKSGESRERQRDDGDDRRASGRDEQRAPPRWR